MFLSTTRISSQTLNAAVIPVNVFKYSRRYKVFLGFRFQYLNHLKFQTTYWTRCLSVQCCIHVSFFLCVCVTVKDVRTQYLNLVNVYVLLSITTSVVKCCSSNIFSFSISKNWCRIHFKFESYLYNLVHLLSPLG